MPFDSAPTAEGHIASPPPMPRAWYVQYFVVPRRIFVAGVFIGTIPDLQFHVRQSVIVTNPEYVASEITENS